jgi:hypothetical protein
VHQLRSNHGGEQKASAKRLILFLPRWESRPATRASNVYSDRLDDSRLRRTVPALPVSFSPIDFAGVFALSVSNPLTRLTCDRDKIAGPRALSPPCDKEVKACPGVWGQSSHARNLPRGPNLSERHSRQRGDLARRRFSPAGVAVGVAVAFLT